MTTISFHSRAVRSQSLRRLARLLRLWTPRAPLVDPESLADHLRRDLGLADGRTAPPRNPMRD